MSLPQRISRLLIMVFKIPLFLIAAASAATSASFHGTNWKRFAGMAQGQLAVTPTSLDFGSVIVGTSKSQMGTLTASGSSVGVSSASVTSSKFSISGITLPLTIAAGKSVPFTLTFIPQTSGSAAASGSFTSNALNVAAQRLTGTGIAPPQHSVDLTWNEASTVVGYNVYRGNQSAGPYTKVNSMLYVSTTYTDRSIQPDKPTIM